VKGQMANDVSSSATIATLSRPMAALIGSGEAVSVIRAHEKATERHRCPTSTSFNWSPHHKERAPMASRLDT
jgi:hypothetical protein